MPCDLGTQPASTHAPDGQKLTNVSTETNKHTNFSLQHLQKKRCSRSEEQHASRNCTLRNTALRNSTTITQNYEVDDWNESSYDGASHLFREHVCCVGFCSDLCCSRDVQCGPVLKPRVFDSVCASLFFTSSSLSSSFPSSSSSKKLGLLPSLFVSPPLCPFLLLFSTRIPTARVKLSWCRGDFAGVGRSASLCA